MASSFRGGEMAGGEMVGGETPWWRGDRNSPYDRPDRLKTFLKRSGQSAR